jgi:hypothetical protein
MREQKDFSLREIGLAIRSARIKASNPRDLEVNLTKYSKGAEFVRELGNFIIGVTKDEEISEHEAVALLLATTQYVHKYFCQGDSDEAVQEDLDIIFRFEGVDA